MQQFKGSIVSVILALAGNVHRVPGKGKTTVTVGATELGLQKRFKESDEVCVEDIGDGKINEVVRVYTTDGRSVIVKHSLPYIKFLGEGYPLGEERIDNEHTALVKFHHLCPGSVPKPYAFDKPNNIVVMEYLRDYQILFDLLVNGQFKKKIANNLGQCLATVHRQTHVGTIGEDAVKELQQELKNSTMMHLVQEFVFTRPFNKEDESNMCTPEMSDQLALVYEDEKILSATEAMCQIYTKKKECVIHGDLHAGAVMVKGTDTRMIDLELSIVGPPGYDLGVFIANFVASYYRHLSIEEDEDTHRLLADKMIDACKLFVNTYLEHMTASSDDRGDYVNNLLSETSGFAGCEIIRRTIGAAHYPYFDGLPLAEVDCLGAGIRLLQSKSRIHDIDRRLVIALVLI